MSLRIIIIVSALVLVALVSCDEDADRIYDPNSSYGILMGLINYFNNHEDEDNIKRVNNALSSNFIFYFDHDDVGDYVGYYKIPVSWTRTEMMSAVRNMFDQAYNIDLQIPILRQGEDAFGKPDEGDTTFAKSNVPLTLTVLKDATDGYQAQGFCDFEFGKGGSGNWLMTTWRDKTGSVLLGIQAATLGTIFALFY